MGPTAAGKTDLAVELAQRLPLAIISVDSAMVYRGLDIGTGKPRPEVLVRAPHRLIDIRDPAEVYSAGQFAEDAWSEIQALRQTARVPLLVGGTGLYFRALQYGLAPLPAANRSVRERLAAEARVLGWPALHTRLAAVDRVAAGRIHPHDPQRIQRALEIYELTGRPMTELIAHHRGKALGLPSLTIVLEPSDRDRLRKDIAVRFQAMLAHGLVEEVEGLRARGDLHRDLPSMRAVGYRQIWDYLEGRVERTATVARAITATCQLAKRQLTWLRSERAAIRLDSQARDLPVRLSQLLKSCL